VIIVADNIRITNRTIEKAVNAMDPLPIQTMVKKCEAAGAEAIDINSGPLNREPERKMTFLVEAIQDVCTLPFLIDTVNPKALEAGLVVSRNKTTINGFSLEPSKLESILPLAKKFNTDIIGYLLYPNGHVPPDGPERLNIAVELFSEYKKVGLPNESLIIDPVVAPLMWQDGNFQNMEILSTLRTLPELLGFDVRTIAGLSNLTSGKSDRDKKILLEKTYLPMILEAGLTMVLMDVFNKETMRAARACRALMSAKVFSWEEV